MNKESMENVRLVPVKGKKDGNSPTLAFWLKVMAIVFVAVISVLYCTICAVKFENEELSTEYDALVKQYANVAEDASITYDRLRSTQNRLFYEDSRNYTLMAYIKADATKKYEDVSKDLEILCKMTGTNELMSFVYGDTDMLANITAIKYRLDVMSGIYTKNADKGNGFDQYLSLIRQIEAKYDILIEMSDMLQEAGASLPKAEKPMMTVKGDSNLNISSDGGSIGSDGGIKSDTSRNGNPSSMPDEVNISPNGDIIIPGIVNVTNEVFTTPNN